MHWLVLPIKLEIKSFNGEDGNALRSTPLSLASSFHCFLCRLLLYIFFSFSPNYVLNEYSFFFHFFLLCIFPNLAYSLQKSFSCFFLKCIMQPPPLGSSKTSTSDWKVQADISSSVFHWYISYKGRHPEVIFGVKKSLVPIRMRRRLVSDNHNCFPCHVF